MNQLEVYSGPLFGVGLVIALAVGGILRRAGETVLVIIASSAAFFVAFMSAFVMRGVFPVLTHGEWGGLIGPDDLFFGGFTGAFFLTFVLDLLFRQGMPVRFRLKRMLVGAACGGFFGFAGWIFHSVLGTAVLRIVHNLGTGGLESSGSNEYEQRTLMYSTYIIWQTGVAFVLGVILGYWPTSSSERSGVVSTTS